jgi:hypothetical protein
MKYLLAITAITAAAASAQTLTPTATVVTPDYAWGYRCGVKQALGAHYLGRTVYNISHETGGRLGSPDYLVWVDEHTGEASINELGHDDANVINPGGQACFDDEGRVWYALGGRGRDLPFDVLRFDEPFSINSWTNRIDDLVTYGGSTTPLLHVLGDLGMHIYRYSGSSRTGEVEVRFQKLDLANGELVSELAIAKGSIIDQQKIGIEQLWSRWDSRIGAIALTWQWWDVDARWFGSNPFVYSDDLGATWKDASGTELALPLAYENRNDVLVPYDHVENEESSEWHPHDIGWTPNGVPFLLNPDGDLDIHFWRWDGDRWEDHLIAEHYLVDTKSFAGGATRDYTFIAYSTSVSPGILWGITSTDDGQTWSQPSIILDAGEDIISTVVWVQPQRYIDNAARLVVLHCQPGANQTTKRNYRNAVDHLKVQIGPRSDFNGDGASDIRDVTAYLNAWAAGDWQADFNDDGTLDTRDVLEFINVFASE